MFDSQYDLEKHQQTCLSIIGNLKKTDPRNISGTLRQIRALVIGLLNGKHVLVHRYVFDDDDVFSACLYRTDDEYALCFVESVEIGITVEVSDDFDAGSVELTLRVKVCPIDVNGDQGEEFDITVYEVDDMLDQLLAELQSGVTRQSVAASRSNFYQRLCLFGDEEKAAFRQAMAARKAEWQSVVDLLEGKGV
jgi:hypothetical protein